MQELCSGKTRIQIPLALGLMLLALTLGLLSPSHPAALAQGNMTAYLPMIFKNVIPGHPEAIMILSPATASRVTGTIHIAGEADPTFEQNLVARVLRADGSVVTQAPTTIQAPAGQRGPFAIDLPVHLMAEQNIFVQVFSTSPRDGGVTHLSSTFVVFTPSGPETILTRDPFQEQIEIFQPQPGAPVSGGSVRVNGFGLASFEQTLLVEVLDGEGDVMGSRSVIVAAPDLGEPGAFQVDVPYSAGTPGPGRIVVRDVSPAFSGNVHLTSVEVTLAP